MFRKSMTHLFLCATLGAGMASLPVRAAESSAGHGSDSVKVDVRDLNIFTHLAYIPASVDPASVRFDNIKRVVVHTQVKYTMDAHYCDTLAFRDPGGSVYCPHVEDETSDVAYEVTYSYRGPPLASDEFGGRYFVAHFHFRVEELPRGLRQAISSGTMKRSETSGYFRVTPLHELARRVVVDEAHSRFCARSLDRRSLTQVEPNCEDLVVYQTVLVPSDYLTVKVDLQ